MLEPSKLVSEAVFQRFTLLYSGGGQNSHQLVLFQKINQLITHKERLLHQLDEYNRVQNEKFSKQLFGVPPCNHQTPGPAPSYPTVGPAPAPAANPDTVYTLPNFESGGEATFSPDPIPQDQGYVYRRRR
ncbi:hypothetical protein J6590_046769 [Homalodisca vitripennis]|nr:hypothetical protein J6590_046769 [Homalodisca vitripennis]